ncbi:choline/ethanolamine kinase [Marchantia polymorpha subsp. ruderalis]|nr:hypothetical protein MARPO_0005s0142 [Marchantia polymorpha]BBM97305.1 hypothetical protein Mp_1g04650 [Marchantia polymorpha subsp. ruderalis]|eukprot:PTQ48501.1 hypothetical protein MARPO_0005s0142 [Marchantia polymorpha]
MVALELELEKEMDDCPSKITDKLTLRSQSLGSEVADDELEIPLEAYTVLHGLAEEWTDISGNENLTLRQLKGAMTNEVFECHWALANKRGKPRKVLLRLYGESSELFFNRENEILTFEKMSQHGQGPRLLARFSTGRVEEFLNARTLSSVDLRNNQISDQVAVKLREFHALDMPGPAEPMIWQRLSMWLEKALELASPNQVEEFSLHLLHEEIANLQKMLRRSGEKIGFCHNDLQYGNLMIDDNETNLTIIDYEYASFNPVAYDIANYFCEMAADYHSDTPHVLDYSKYPDYENRRRFAAMYLQATGESVDEVEIDALVKETDSYRLASHLLWGCWGLISAHTSDIDFNYLEYARQRFQQYYLVKKISL